MSLKQSLKASLLMCFPALLILSACYQTSDMQCHYSSDCEAGDFCRAGQCIPASNPPIILNPNAPPHDRDTKNPDDDTNHTSPTTPPPPPCPEARTPQPGDIILNEILVNVPPGLAGDANGDGIRHAHDDEFVELVNISDQQLDLTGVKIQNAASTKYTFHRFCLDPGHPVVVFGGLEHGAKLPSTPAVHTMIAHSRFMFNNEQGTIVIRQANDNELLRIDYDRSPPQALTLSPELYGDRFISHNALTPGTLFSPGTCADGQPITSGCPIANESEVDDLTDDQTDEPKDED